MGLCDDDDGCLYCFFDDFLREGLRDLVEFVVMAMAKG
jgi:hypothetical protein